VVSQAADKLRFDKQPGGSFALRMRSAPAQQLESASKTLISFATEMASSSGLPILDAGCGFGRNAVALALGGMSVVCADRRPERLNTLVRFGSKYVAERGQPNCRVGKLYPILVDLHPATWPFRENCFAGILSVHFVKINLFEMFRSSLIPGGFLYLETFEGHGKNYLDLPQVGQLRDLLSKDFQTHFYREKKVGPIGYNAATVRLFARRRHSSNPVGR
jgi:SAM-dependent methyltransferase